MYLNRVKETCREGNLKKRVRSSTEKRYEMMERVVLRQGNTKIPKAFSISHKRFRVNNIFYSKHNNCNLWRFSCTILNPMTMPTRKLLWPYNKRENRELKLGKIIAAMWHTKPFFPTYIICKWAHNILLVGISSHPNKYNMI